MVGLFITDGHQYIQVWWARLSGCSKNLYIPRSTLQRKVQRNEDHTTPLGRKPILSGESENQLAELILNMEARGFGLIRYDVRSLAYEYVEKNNLSHKFNHTTKLAGRYWLVGILKRHPDILCRVKLRDFPSQEQVEWTEQQFPSTLINLVLFLIVKACTILQKRIYNVDETGLPMINRPLTVLAKKGKKSAVTVTDTERGENATVVGCCSASGQYIPPYVIWKGRVRRRNLRMVFPWIWACHVWLFLQ